MRIENGCECPCCGGGMEAEARGLGCLRCGVRFIPNSEYEAKLLREADTACKVARLLGVMDGSVVVRRVTARFAEELQKELDTKERITLPAGYKPSLEVGEGDSLRVVCEFNGCWLVTKKE
jgi:hypothetical protein